MKIEVRAMYTNGYGTIPHEDIECSVPVREVPDDEAKKFMGLCEEIGWRRRETATHIFYTEVRDASHCVEHIFYK